MRNTSASSMQSPPTSADATRVIILPPVLAASRRSFLLTFKTVAIGCSLFPGGFLFQNHYPRFRGAPSGCFKGCPHGPSSVDSGKKSSAWLRRKLVRQFLLERCGVSLCRSGCLSYPRLHEGRLCIGGGLPSSVPRSGWSRRTKPKRFLPPGREPSGWSLRGIVRVHLGGLSRLNCELFAGRFP